MEPPEAIARFDLENRLPGDDFHVRFVVGALASHGAKLVAVLGNDWQGRPENLIIVNPTVSVGKQGPTVCGHAVTRPGDGADHAPTVALIAEQPIADVNHQVSPPLRETIPSERVQPLGQTGGGLALEVGIERDLEVGSDPDGERVAFLAILPLDMLMMHGQMPHGESVIRLLVLVNVAYQVLRVTLGRCVVTVGGDDDFGLGSVFGVHFCFSVCGLLLAMLFRPTVRVRPSSPWSPNDALGRNKGGFVR